MEWIYTFLEGLSRAAGMGWKTFWALVLGFTISGAVQTFVSEARMSRVLGGRGLREILLGTVFGAASSSCSFGAVATTKSLFKKGTSAVASLAAFQFASTNLVIELGLVMWVLLGWQFVLANFLAGLVLIALLSLVFRFVIPAAWFEEAREHTRAQELVRDPQCGMEVDPQDEDTEELETEQRTYYFCSTGCKEAFKEKLEEGEVPGDEDEKVYSLASMKGWKEASQHTLQDWRMLWKEIIAGFVIAGMIAAFVPREWWTALLTLAAKDTFLYLLWGCVIGVVIGVVTFVCSVGNVPFALILWQSGMPFGGVMSFIFADLIVPHITNAYRKYYGLRMALVMFFSIFGCAVIAGLIIHGLSLSLSLIPQQGQLGGTAPEGYTLYLNLFFGVIFLIQFLWTHGIFSSQDVKGEGKPHVREATSR